MQAGTPAFQSHPPFARGRLRRKNFARTPKKEKTVGATAFILLEIPSLKSQPETKLNLPVGSQSDSASDR